MVFCWEIQLFLYSMTSNQKCLKWLKPVLRLIFKRDYGWKDLSKIPHTEQKKVNIKFRNWKRWSHINSFHINLHKSLLSERFSCQILMKLKTNWYKWANWYQLLLNTDLLDNVGFCFFYQNICKQYLKRIWYIFFVIL